MRTNQVKSLYGERSTLQLTCSYSNIVLRLIQLLVNSKRTDLGRLNISLHMSESHGLLKF